MNTLDLKTFADYGYLQELNRQFLHPLGMALALYERDDGTCRFDSITDFRDEPDGMIFNELNKVKAEAVIQEQKTKAAARQESLGYVVQPLQH